MASGSVVVIVHQIMPPATSFAAFGVRAGASSPAEQVPHWAFDAAADEYLDFYCTLEGYGGNGLTFSIKSMAATATTGGALIALAIRRIADDAEDIDTAQTYDYNEVRIPCASASGEYSYDTITFTNGADMDNLAEGEDFILRMRRRGSDNTSTTGDDMAGDFQFIDLIGLES
jgi:hypothetical protein